LKLKWGVVAIYSEVYEPSDDTWFLIEVLEKRLLGERFGRCLDLGCGSGVVGLYLLSRGICLETFFIDVNEYALINSRDNLLLNNLGHRGLPIHISDLDGLFREPAFDLVVANPPYLPGSPRDRYEYSIYCGARGYETIVDFIDFSHQVLEDSGRLYVVYSSLSNVGVVEDHLRKRFQLNNRWSRHFFFEDIYVVEAVKS